MREVMTYKSGKFYFTDVYDQNRIANLLLHANILQNTILSLPLLPDWSSQINPEIMYNSIAGTAAIEGNAINEQDVRKIAEGKAPEAQYSQKHQTEIKNLINAYTLIDNISVAQQPFKLSEELVCELHRVITIDIPDENNIPGAYRNGKVYVGDTAHGGIYTPPKILEDITRLMQEFIEWINCEDITNKPPFIRATLAHYHFALIHPFWDGNGRVARLIEALLLQSAGIKYAPKSLSNYYYKHVDDYYIAFSKSIKEKKEITSFLEFTLKGVINILLQMKEVIIFFIKKLALRDYLHVLLNNEKRISKRQHDLISLLLDKSNDTVSLNELSAKRPYSLLYRRVSSQTARRDLKKLLEIKLLRIDESGRYLINLDALG